MTTLTTTSITQQDIANLTRSASLLLDVQEEVETARRILDFINRAIAQPSPPQPQPVAEPDGPEPGPFELADLRKWVLAKHAQGEEWIRVPEVMHTFRISSRMARALVQDLAREGLLAPKGEKLRGRRIAPAVAKRLLKKT